MNILCIQLLAAVLLVSCGQTLVLHNQLLFPVDRAIRRKKGLAMRDQPDLSSVQNVGIAKLKAITPCGTEERGEKWSGHDRLQSVLHGFLLFWVYYFSDFSIGCNNSKMMTMKKTTVQLQLGCKPCILLQSTCTTTYQVTTRVKLSIWSHKQAACSGKISRK